MLKTTARTSCDHLGLLPVCRFEDGPSAGVLRVLPDAKPLRPSANTAYQCPSSTSGRSMVSSHRKESRDTHFWGIVENHDTGLDLIVVETARLYLDQIGVLSSGIASLETRSDRKRSVRRAPPVIRWACRKAPPEHLWLAPMLARKPGMLVAVTLANEMARSL